MELDYDSNPDRFRTGRSVSLRFGPGDLHPQVAGRVRREGLIPLLDAGCGEGALGRALGGGPGSWVGLDLSATMLAAAPRPVVRGDIARLPFRDGTFRAVASLWVLYHLHDPVTAIAEAYRVLRQGGLYATSTTSRFDSPEIADLVQPGPTSFDAEEAEALVAGVFDDVEVERWDAPLIELPDIEALRQYLVGRGVPAPGAARLARRRRDFPLRITKRGALVYGRKLTGKRTTS